jgi:hypothetical protein
MTDDDLPHDVSQYAFRSRLVLHIQTPPTARSFVSLFVPSDEGENIMQQQILRIYVPLVAHRVTRLTGH